MAYQTDQRLKEYKKKHRMRSIWKRVLCVMGCLVVFCTTYALILPAITEEHTAYCGIEEHTHSAEAGCYEPVLICSLEENHIHSEACYEQTLVCQQTEHIHTLSCFSNPNADVETAADWEATFAGVELTGEYYADVLAIAETQIGYKESAENYIVLEDGETTKGYTRYGAWYGMPYEDWCAMFVSFCLNYANVPTEVFPQSAGCESWIEALEEQGLYYTAAQYQSEEIGGPYEGDLVFFDWADGDGNYDGLADHVGIVSERIFADDGYTMTGFKTIEGNSGNQVEVNEYSFLNENGDVNLSILGYGQLPCENGIMAAAEGNTVATISPSSTIINLFDYRVNVNSANWKEDGLLDTGINVSHALKFAKGMKSNLGTANRNSPNGVVQGIVNQTLGDDGYPVLSSSMNFYWDNGNADQYTELNPLRNVYPSLDYLFNTSDLYSAGQAETSANLIKKAYPNVKGLLQLGSDGYYYYDSTKNYAEFPVDDTTRESTNNNRFNVYDEWRVTGTNSQGQFFPFDLYSNVAQDTAASNVGLNHFFGLHMKTYFIQNYSGFTDSGKTTHTIFDFSGDDDVWIFVDGVLVADLGGIHDAVNVTVDFAAGTVTISKVYNNQVNVTRQFSEIFKNTDVELANYNGKTTLVNNSSHTLDFFYLERGGGYSNMKLKYNLLEIPATSIYKIDQYGDVLAGAEFAVYGATKQTNGDYWYNTDQINENGTPVAVSLKNYTYWDGEGDTPTTSYWKYRWDSGGDKWDILATSIDADTNTTTTTTIPCKYHGTTDGNGEMIFQSADGSLYSLDNLVKDVIGSHNFILREVHVPNGYRTVSDESWFRIDEDAGVMICDSTYTSGVWASNNAQVTANNTLYAVKAYNETAKTMGFTADGERYSYSGYMNSTGETVSINGTLFAVVLKRNDKTSLNDNGTSLDVDAWYPVYGSDEVGYTVVGENGEYTDTVTGKDGVKTTVTYGSQIEAVIAAAQKQEDVTGTGSAVFTPSTVNGEAVSAQLVLKNLPGKIDRYYTYIQQKKGGELLNEIDANGDPQYFVAYYYTTANSVDEATVGNTVRVVSRQNVINGYDGFNIAWGTTIEVPNMENRLFFQKRDEAKSTSRTNGLLNGAVFALYPAIDAAQAFPNQDNHLSYYIGSDSPTAGEGNTVYIIPYSGTPKENPEKVAVFGYTDGTLGHLGDGIIEEIKTDGIVFNTANGLANNANGTAGTITVTLKTDGDGNKLPDGGKYYIHPVTNADGYSMVGVTHSSCGDINEAGTGHFNKLPEGEYLLREILAPSGYEENTTDIPVLVNELGVYAYAGGEEPDGVSVGNGIGFLSKTIDVFANLNEIDESLAWVYGALLRSDATGFTAFDDVTHDVIHVADTNWKFVKQKETDPPGYGSETVEKDDRSQAMVIYYEYNGELSDSGKHVIFDYTPNDDTGGQDARTETMLNGKTVVGFVPTQAGQTNNGTLLYRLWTMAGWSDLAIYQDYAYGIQQNTTTATTNYDDLTGYGNLSNLFSSSTFVQVTDTPSAVDLKVVKISSEKDKDGKDVPLAGAQFRIRREVTETTTDADGNTVTAIDKAWYYYDADALSTIWEPDESKVMSNTTDGEGSTIFYDLSPREDAIYYLEEYKPPSGYVTVGEIAFTVQTVTETGSEGTETYIPTLTLTGTKPDNVVLSDPVTDDSGTPVYTLTIPNNPDPNTYVARVNLDLTKVAQDGTTPLTGAQFQLYREKTETVDGEKVTTREYYRYTLAGTDTDAKTEWVAADQSPTTLTSDANGKVQTFFDLKDIVTAAEGSTTYYLVETAAPAGYNLLAQPIQIKVDITDGKNVAPVVKITVSVDGTNIYTTEGTNNPGSGGYSVTPAEPTSGETVNKEITVTYLYTLTIPNSSGYALPETGGMGTDLYTMAGILLLCSGAICLLYRYFKIRGKEANS